ncbi:methyltransferase domain-containing protein [Streptomyces sp. Isolate_219]|uniref:methyltransferase domain-containing protein n=1 Tax=Streptomyces sp. Isolate_219 TaxID=2950110 RepID=UPI0021C72382|nr:methyltransferase domain-containing protein [Streptomyces sp. Isolate_219]MCR8573336.1 methyltransferase domain-containing protein [Streptomyces sp. Isolate_219]
MGSAPLIALDSAGPDTVDGRQIRAAAFQGVRLAYTSGVLERLGRPRSGRALVVGSGRGLLARGLAGLGFQVTAVDPSESASVLARAAAERDGLTIEHRTAPAERPAVPEAAFDLVYLADTLEITADPGRVVEQAARALAPGGVLVYDTVNRTPVSRLVYLVAFQRLPMTRIVPAGRYAASRLRTPSEVAALLARHGLTDGGICDFKPHSVRGLIAGVRARRAGRVTDDVLEAMVGFALAPGSKPLVTYLGHARKGRL